MKKMFNISISEEKRNEIVRDFITSVAWTMIWTGVEIIAEQIKESIAEKRMRTLDDLNNE